MARDETYSPPFDEQAALEELERLRQAIEESRRRRTQTSDEFEAFVRSFRAPAAGSATAAPPSTPATAPPPASAWTPAAPAAPAAPPITASPWPQPAAPAPVAPAVVPPPAAPPKADFVEPFKAEPAHATPETVDELPGEVEPARPQKRRTRSLAPRLLGGAGILVASILLLTRPWKSVRSESTASPSPGGGTPTTASAPATPEPAQATSAQPPAAAAVETPRAMQAELNVERRVWVRVLVDGERVIERELAAGTRIPLQADRAIVIRAGDAGALRLTLNGTDRGLLGREGEIVTRTFTAPTR
jgi:Domain of unknown function (DUF4115)